MMKTARESFCREARFLRRNRSQILKTFLDDSHKQTATAWGLTPRAYQKVAEDVAQMSASEMKKFLSIYRSTPTQQQRGEMENMRMLLMEIQTYASGQLDINERE